MHLFYNQQYNKLRDQVNPNSQELEQFLHANEAYEQAHRLRGLKLKYQAMTREPTTIEKTMTPYQLYQANNPLWARELSALGIESFLDLEDTMEYNLDLSEGIYTELSGGTYKLSKEMFDNTYEYALNQMNPRTVDFASYYPKIMMEPTIMAQPKITIRQ
jgi:hypothetical protein